MNPQNNKDADQQVVALVIEPAIQINQRLKDEVLEQVEQQGMVVVQCSCVTEIEMRIRIWETTVLIDHSSGNRSKLLHAFGITVAPVWMFLEAGTTARFTLVFEKLPKTCESFDLYEDIPEDNGFHIKNIRRNKSDVYNIRIT
ncbi:MAG: hypothetical protein PHP04_05510 [Bacteroidales bacterium]|nr:hypothetical protein [Bacteroidales bacterium]HNW74017.1 hypothetical protein [Bacteroidales bacterium]HPS50155.1 hypothetical protein [Bacteroidales bacterium]